jgi:hypothetical protein
MVVNYKKHFGTLQIGNSNTLHSVNWYRKHYYSSSYWCPYSTFKMLGINLTTIREIFLGIFYKEDQFEK